VLFRSLAGFGVVMISPPLRRWFVVLDRERLCILLYGTCSVKCEVFVLLGFWGGSNPITPGIVVKLPQV
jgi:hypothetical protein